MIRKLSQIFNPTFGVVANLGAWYTENNMLYANELTWKSFEPLQIYRLRKVKGGFKFDMFHNGYRKTK